VLLGKVELVAADGQTRAIPRRIEGLSGLFGSLVEPPAPRRTRTT